jgi:hypothetical protein
VYTKLIAILMLIAGVAAGANPPYSNTNGWYGYALPPLTSTVGILGNPGKAEYLQAGYRTNTIVDVPMQTNLVATHYNVVDLDGIHAQLTVDTTTDWVIAAEAARVAQSNFQAQVKQDAATNYVFTTRQLFLFVLAVQTNMPAANRCGVGKAATMASNIIYYGKADYP